LCVTLDVESLVFERRHGASLIGPRLGAAAWHFANERKPSNTSSVSADLAAIVRRRSASHGAQRETLKLAKSKPPHEAGVWG
jgi:hypothetical protein